MAATVALQPALHTLLQPAKLAFDSAVWTADDGRGSFLHRRSANPAYVATFMHNAAIAVGLAFLQTDGLTAKRTRRHKHRLVSHSSVQYS